MVARSLFSGSAPCRTPGDVIADRGLKRLAAVRLGQRLGPGLINDNTLGQDQGLQLRDFCALPCFNGLSHRPRLVNLIDGLGDRLAAVRRFRGEEGTAG